MIHRRGAILLEILLSLALFVMTASMLLSVIGQVVDGLGRSRDRLTAADRAESALALIETGLARPETLNGPVEPWQPEQDDSMTGIDPDDAPSSFDAEPRWALQIETEPSEYEGLTLVSVRAYRIDETESEIEGSPSVTLRRLVRLSASPPDAASGGLSPDDFTGNAVPRPSIRAGGAQR